MYVICHLSLCRILKVFSFNINLYFQNVLFFKPCVQISNCFYYWISRVEIFKTRSHVNSFDELFFL